MAVLRFCLLCENKRLEATEQEMPTANRGVHNDDKEKDRIIHESPGVLLKLRFGSRYIV